MKNKKSFFLIASMTVLAVTLYAQQYAPESDFSAKIIDNGRAVEIIKYVGSRQTVNIPPTFEGIPVTSIGDQAFSFCSSLTGVAIPNGVTSIGDQAFFGCTSLASVTIPDSITSIGGGVFSEYSKLTSITIPNGITRIASIYIDQNNSIGAFRGCTSLASVTIPDSVTSIEINAFLGCTSLASITIPNSVTSIGRFAFANCYKLTGVTIPSAVTSIGDNAFYNCTSLTSVNIPNGVSSIGDQAFSGCTSLTSVTIPDSVTSIGDQIFSGCTSLAVINVSALNANYSSEDGILFNKNKTTLIQCPGGKTGAYTIPNSVTSIGEGAFFGCTKLTGVTIPDSVTSIGRAAFDCTSLTTINVSALNANFSSEDGVLFNKDKTTLIRCPGGKTGAYTIPNSVTSIGFYAFYGCISLTSVTFQKASISIDRAFFYGDLPDKYRAGGIGTYKTTTPVPKDWWDWKPVWTKQ